jgi:hypothetical protein
MIGCPRAVRLPRYACLLLLLGLPASGQFKQIGPPPFSPAVAHQRIRALLDGLGPTNRQQTIDKIDSLTPWFRGVLDEELIAAWQREGRDRLVPVMEPLASPRVAEAVVEFSWRKRTDATLNLSYAPLLGHLMARYPESGKVFLSDLQASPPPALSPAQEEAVCRILIDMPEVGNWNEGALQILPHYRATAERLLTEDKRADDLDRRYRAHTLLAELGGDRHETISQRPVERRRAAAQPAPVDGGPLLFPPPDTGSSPDTADRRPEPSPPAGAPSLMSPTPSEIRPLHTTPVLPAPQPYSGATSGTLVCNGGPIPQNAEYVFRNLPPLRLRLDYDTRLWEARLSPGENQTQRVILRNRSSGPQKKCVVHWSVVP